MASCLLQVEGTCNGKYGFVLSVLNVIDTGKGLVSSSMRPACPCIAQRCSASGAPLRALARLLRIQRLHAAAPTCTHMPCRRPH